MVNIRSMGKEVASGFSKHDLLTLAAALAFYTALSLAPLIVITLAVVGLLGQNSQDQLIEQLQGLMGPQAARAIQTVVESNDNRPSMTSLAGLIGVVALLFSASGVFAQLQASLNKIFEAEEKAAGKGMWAWIRKRLLSMGMVITLGFLAVVSLVVSTAITYFFPSDGVLWRTVNVLVTLAVFAGMFSLVFKYLPDTKLKWREALYGGVATAILFAIGKYLIGVYLGKSAVGSAYGAAGSLVVFLVWVYYSSAIVFTGAEITRVLSGITIVDSKKKPEKNPQLRPATT